MKNLFEEFKKLQLPSKVQSYSAVPIKGSKAHRLGKDINDSPSILLSTFGRKNVLKMKNQKLYNLSIFHDLECEVEFDNKIFVESFTVITYSGSDEVLKEYFLKVCELLINSLGIEPTNEEIRNVTNRLIELFRVLKEPPRKTIQGLWSELFLINQSKAPAKLVRAWHCVPEERYDFSFESMRLEVKSTSTRNRVHHFSLEQLVPPLGAKLFIVSVFTEVSSVGKSISDLISEIESKLSDQKLVNKLRLVTYATLGNSITEMNYISYDLQIAKDSIRFYESKDIPKIEVVPLHVSKVEFRSSLEGISYLGNLEYT